MIVTRLRKLHRNAVIVAGSLTAVLVVMVAGAWTFISQAGKTDQTRNSRLAAAPINEKNWGEITAPVYGSSEAGVYSSAELFAGPNKFDKLGYFSGVLPNGRIVKPAGISIQVGMNPLGIALTPDDRYLITSNDDERPDEPFVSYLNDLNVGRYSLSVVDVAKREVVATYHGPEKFFVGLQVTATGPAGTAPYTIWASGGPDNDVKRFLLSADADGKNVKIEPDPKTPRIPITPILPQDKGYVSHYVAGKQFGTKDSSGNQPPVPSHFKDAGSTRITFPAGLALSTDQRYLYVACNGDNSVAVIDTRAFTVVRRQLVGYFPYSVSVWPNGEDEDIAVSNWGVTEYKFKDPKYDAAGDLIAIKAAPQDDPDRFGLPKTSTQENQAQTSSISILKAANKDGAMLSPIKSVYQGEPLDENNHVGDTHPSATVIVGKGSEAVLYVTKSNSDALGLIRLKDQAKLPDFDMSIVQVSAEAKVYKLHGAYPNALVVSPGGELLFVAEAGINSVAVLDVKQPAQPSLLGRIATGWYPTALAVSRDGNSLYISNAKGIAGDLNKNIRVNDNQVPANINSPPSRLFSDPLIDSNHIFGTLQKVDLRLKPWERDQMRENNFARHSSMDTSIVPVGGGPSTKIKYVFFILHENKTFDSMLGNLSQWAPFASLSYNQRNGSPYWASQFTGVSMNTQALAQNFAVAVNYYSDSEESDAGHQFAASGTASDYTEKTLLVKDGRGLLVNKNFEPEDYPEHGYIFNNAARNGVSFKDYGAMIRISGTDTGESVPTKLNDPGSGNAGGPKLDPSTAPWDAIRHLSNPLGYAGDEKSLTSGLGQSYFLALPILAVLGDKNPSGEPHLDLNYPGYNFNISDRRRAVEFINDFERMRKAGSLPSFFYIYQPNDHTGAVKAPNAAQIGTSAFQQVADGDAALGMVVQHIMQSPIYHESAIFITWDDAQSTVDHIHPHRTPLLVVSPYAKPGLAKRHYSTASVVKTEELLLGLPPNNLGDLFATDLRDMFQPTDNGVTANKVDFKVLANYAPSPEGSKIWALVSRLDTSAPDRDSFRLGELTRLSMDADDLHKTAVAQHRLRSISYRAKQAQLYAHALRLVNSPAPRDED